MKILNAYSLSYLKKKSILDSYIIINKMINNIRKKVIINLFENYDKMK